MSWLPKSNERATRRERLRGGLDVPNVEDSGDDRGDGDGRYGRAQWDPRGRRPGPYGSEYVAFDENSDPRPSFPPGTFPIADPRRALPALGNNMNNPSMPPERRREVREGSRERSDHRPATGYNPSIPPYLQARGQCDQQPLVPEATGNVRPPPTLYGQLPPGLSMSAIGQSGSQRFMQLVTVGYNDDRTPVTQSVGSIIAEFDQYINRDAASKGCIPNFRSEWNTQGAVMKYWTEEEEDLLKWLTEEKKIIFGQMPPLFEGRTAEACRRRYIGTRANVRHASPSRSTQSGIQPRDELNTPLKEERMAQYREYRSNQGLNPDVIPGPDPTNHMRWATWTLVEEHFLKWMREVQEATFEEIATFFPDRSRKTCQNWYHDKILPQPWRVFA